MIRRWLVCACFCISCDIAGSLQMSHLADQSMPNFHQTTSYPIALRLMRTCTFSMCSGSMPSTPLPPSNIRQSSAATTTHPLCRSVATFCVRQFALTCHRELQTLCTLQATCEQLRLACCTCTARFPAVPPHMLQQTTPMLYMVPSARPVLSTSTNSGLESVRHGLYFGK